MKQYNKILEAIHRGINLALDDFDDNDELIGQQELTIKDISYSTKLLDLSKLFVDLGLPSGTWWAKANLGATCGDTIESWFGDYYAFGDPEPNKNEWSERNYNSKIKHKYDYLDQLQPEDDQAKKLISIHSFDIHVPTKEQCEELIKYCDIIPNDAYKLLTYKALNIPMHLHGYIVKSKINGNEIFIPNAGYGFLNDISYINESCGVQSANVYKSDHYRYYGLCLMHNDKSCINISYYRTAGLPIRPVSNYI